MTWDHYPLPNVVMPLFTCTQFPKHLQVLIPLHLLWEAFKGVCHGYSAISFIRLCALVFSVFAIMLLGQFLVHVSALLPVPLYPVVSVLWVVVLFLIILFPPPWCSHKICHVLVFVLCLSSFPLSNVCMVYSFVWDHGVVLLNANRLFTLQR